jgi:hypothetical protein
MKIAQHFQRWDQGKILASEPVKRATEYGGTGN